MSQCRLRARVTGKLCAYQSLETCREVVQVPGAMRLQDGGEACFRSSSVSFQKASVDAEEFIKLRRQIEAFRPLPGPIQVRFLTGR